MSNMVANRHQNILWWLKQATNKFRFCRALFETLFTTSEKKLNKS